MATTPTMATCTEAQWTFNSANQSPCVVGSALAGTCVGGDFTLVDLEEGFVYLGPTAAAATPCRCSSVYYSMLSACATCQGEDFVRWGSYSANCETVYSGVFPRPLPQGLLVPSWAYLNVETEDTFNITTARALAANGVESSGTAPPPSSTGTSSRPPSTAGGSSSSGPASTAVPPGDNSSADSAGSSGTSGHKNTGAIAGGVVGGVLGLALIAGLIFFFLRRRNQGKRVPPSAAIYEKAPLGSPPTSPPPHTLTYGDGSTTYQHTGNSGGVPQPPVYNPDNPSTYPTEGSFNHGYSGQVYPAGGPAQPGYQDSHASQSHNILPPTFTGHTNVSGTTFGNHSTTPSHPTRYTGAPEL